MFLFEELSLDSERARLKTNCKYWLHNSENADLFRDADIFSNIISYGIIQP